jgi:hypothetical protein
MFSQCDAAEHILLLYDPIILTFKLRSRIREREVKGSDNLGYQD